MKKHTSTISQTSEAASTAKRVIVFSAELLHLSETFILEQAKSLTQWHPILVGERLVPNGLPLDGLEKCLLCPPEEGRLRRWSYVLCRMLHLPHLPSVWRLRQLRASLINVHFGTIAVEIWPTVRALNLPMLVTLHGYDINIHPEWWASGKGGWQRKKYPKRLLQLAKNPNVHFIAVSKAIRNRAIEYGIPAHKITVNYIGVDLIKFQPSSVPVIERARRVLFVGRLVENKGVEYLIRAFALTYKNIHDAELVIVGEGGLKAYLEELATSLGISVTFLGALKTDQVVTQMSAARILCLPSITIGNGAGEAFGLVLLEAQASGLPVVSSAIGGTIEALVDSKTGYLVPEKNIETLADRLQVLLIDNNLCQTFSKNAVEYVRKYFDLRACSTSLEQSYNAAIALNK